MITVPAPSVAARPDDQDELLRDAVRVLIGNWHGHATVPSRSLYPHQWSWDSAFIALGLQHWAPRRAAIELISLFGAQWQDGRIPHIAFNPAIADHAYFPGPSFWQSSSRAGHPPIDTSGIIQPPVHAVAAAAVMRGLGTEGAAFAERAYPHLVAQNAYLRQHRTVEGLGLAAAAHPWETGMDNSPAWDQPLRAVPADLSIFDTYTRRDLLHADEDERPTDEDYARYIRLALAYRDHDYDDDWLRGHAEFLVIDPAFNALWAWSELALVELAERLGQDATGHRAEATRIGAAMAEHLYAADRGLFLARNQRPRDQRPPDGRAGNALAGNARAGQLLPERTIGGLIPLLLPDLPSEIVDGVVATLLGPSFRGGDPGVIGVPSFDRTDPRYDPQRYWRGPTWLNTTWLVAQGLGQHGRRDLADELHADMARLVRGSGLREYFNPSTGSGHGTTSFSWSAALTIHTLLDPQV